MQPSDWFVVLQAAQTVLLLVVAVATVDIMFLARRWRRVNATNLDKLYKDLAASVARSERPDEAVSAGE